MPGGRLFCRSVEKRYGGGGFNTGSALLALGHEVVLVTSICDDEEGRAYLRALGERGFITDFIRLVPGWTTPADILIEPGGERTIIGHIGARKPGIDALPPIDAPLVYLNTKSLGPAAIRHLDDSAYVISQFPLSGDRRPADVMIGSRSDMMRLRCVAGDRGSVTAAARRPRQDPSWRGRPRPSSEGASRGYAVAADLFHSAASSPSIRRVRHLALPPDLMNSERSSVRVR